MSEVFTFSARGTRQTNDDFILYKQLSATCSIYLLADGMGGYLHGEIASSIACRTIYDYLSANLDKNDIPGSIVHSLESANAAISLQHNLLNTKLGTTIAGAIIETDTAYLFWLGDVRIFHYRGANILFQSEDHSLLNEMRENGIVSATDIARFRNIVTRSLMGDNLQNKVPLMVRQILPGDTLIICSDGLWQNWNVSALKDTPETDLIKLLSENETTSDDNYSIIRLQI